MKEMILICGLESLAVSFHADDMPQPGDTIVVNEPELTGKFLVKSVMDHAIYLIRTNSAHA